MRSAWRGRRWQRIALAVGTLVASSAILLVLVYRERDVLLTYQWDLRWDLVAYACILLNIGLIIAAFVWADIMRRLGSNVATFDHVRYFAVAHLARRLPGTLWYVAGRSYFYQAHGDSVRLVAVASGLEFIITVVSCAAVALAFVALLMAQLPGYYLLGLLAAVGVGIVFTHPAVVRALLRRMKMGDVTQLRYASILRWLILYALIWLLGGLILFLIAAAIAPLGWEHLAYVIGVWCSVSAISVAVFFLPSNFGVTEVGISLLLSAIMPSAIAVLVAVMARLLFIAYELIGAGAILAVHSLMQRRHPRRTPDASVSPNVDLHSSQN